MGSVVLNFVGGIPFQALHEVVKMTIDKSRKFKTHLVNLDYTLRCFKSRTLEQIRENNVRLNLDTETVEDVERKMKAGKALVEKLSKLNMWNIQIWGNCCNCLGPDYAKELDDLDRSLRSLLESLQVENVTRLVSLAREATDRQHDMEKRLGELEEKLDAILRGQQESNAISMEQREAIERLVLHSVQQAPLSSGGRAADPDLRVAFRQLVDAVIQVEVENMMVKRLLDTFKSTLYCLQPLIEEVVEHGRVVHLPKQEVESLIILLVSDVDLVHKCSKVRKHANYKKYEFIDRIFNLEESVFKLFIELKGQVERTLKEATDSANKIEMAINKIEAEGLCNVQLPELPSPAVGFDILNMQRQRDVTEETLLDSAIVKEEGVKQIEGSNAVQNQMKAEGSSHDVLPELHSPANGLDVLNMQGPLDLITTNMQVVGVTESKEINAVDDSIRNVRETADLLDEESSESEPAFPTALFDVPDVHQRSDEVVTFDKQIEGEIATAESLSSSPAVGWTSASATNEKAKLKQPEEEKMRTKALDVTVELGVEEEKFDSFPIVRSGAWADIGARQNMEDVYICVDNFMHDYGLKNFTDGPSAFYGVFDGHGGKHAADFACSNLPKFILEDEDFPGDIQKVVSSAFLQTDTAFQKACTLDATLASSGTTALTALLVGRLLVVANAGDCRAVLCRRGKAIEMSSDHTTINSKEKKRVEACGGSVCDGYLNGSFHVTRALGNWDLVGMKSRDGGPLSAEPEVETVKLTEEDEFLIIGSDGIWDVFSSQDAVDFARRRLQKHNDPATCSKDLVDEALKRYSTDNLVAVVVCFQHEPQPNLISPRCRAQKICRELEELEVGEFWDTQAASYSHSHGLSTKLATS